MNTTHIKPQSASTTHDVIKVLLVEDDPMTRWIVRRAFKNECDFVTAPTIKQASRIYNAYKPDVVFLDINLPDGNGYSILDQIIDNNPNACVIMFSASDEADNIMTAYDRGASGFIPKPFTTENLLHYIHKHELYLQQS